MCRSCKSDAPKWGHGVRVPVKDLPRFFESQQSWNFEQKIYGRNVEILENVRPTLTGHLGCRDTSSSHRENQFLVREIFHCPGWRYGCTPRVGCSGKRKNCYALCKVAVYSDNPEIGVVQYAGSHGSGNPTNPVRHRPTNRVRQFIRQQHLVSGATPAQLEYAIRRAAIQEGKDINDPRHVPTSAMIRHIVKRARTGPTEKKQCLKSQANKTLDTLRTLTSVADIVRPIAVKASSSPLCSSPSPLCSSPPDQQFTPENNLSLGALQHSPNPISLLPIQLAGLAEIIVRNQIKNMWSGKHIPVQQIADDAGSVGSLSPGTPPDTRHSPSRQLSTLGNQTEETESTKRWDGIAKQQIWRPYLAS